MAVSEVIVEKRWPREQARGRSADIDLLRGMAALVVAAYHTWETTWAGIREFWNLHGPDVTFPLVWGSIGVPISIYIVHLPVVVLIHSIVFNSVKQVSIAPFYATLIAVIGCAYAFSFICEKPALAFSQMLKIGTRRHSRLFTKESCGVP